MKGRAFIERLRARGEQLVATRAEQALLADAVEEADESTRTTIESYCPSSEGWWDTSAAEPSEVGEIVDWSLSYLDRRGLIERKEGEPHLVRFVKETGE